MHDDVYHHFPVTFSCLYIICNEFYGTVNEHEGKINNELIECVYLFFL